MPNCYRVLDLFWQDNIQPRSKMTTVSRFSRQYDAGLRALNVALWENLVLVVVLDLVLESKGHFYFDDELNYSFFFVLINLTSLVSTNKIQKNSCFEVGLVRIISIKAKEQFLGRYLWLWSILTRISFLLPASPVFGTSSSRSNIYLIIGGVLGAICAVLLIALICFCCYRKRKRDSKYLTYMSVVKPLCVGVIGCRVVSTFAQELYFALFG